MLVFTVERDQQTCHHHHHLCLDGVTVYTAYEHTIQLKEFLKDLSVYHINVLSICNTFTILIGYMLWLL